MILSSLQEAKEGEEHPPSSPSRPANSVYASPRRESVPHVQLREDILREDSATVRSERRGSRADPLRASVRITEPPVRRLLEPDVVNPLQPLSHTYSGRFSERKDDGITERSIRSQRRPSKRLLQESLAQQIVKGAATALARNQGELRKARWNRIFELTRPDKVTRRIYNFVLLGPILFAIVDGSWGLVEVPANQLGVRLAVDIGILLLFICDAAVSFVTPQYNTRQCSWRSDVADIRKHHLWSTLFWMDVLPCFPIELLAPLLVPHGRVYQLFRCLRGLFKSYKGSFFLDPTTSFPGMEERGSDKRNAFRFFQVAWFLYMAYVPLHFLTTVTCMTRVVHEEECEYVDAMYLTLYTLSSVGYGDIVNKGKLQKIWAMVMMALGTLCLGVVVGWMTENVMSRDNVASSIDSNLQEMASLLDHYAIPVSLRREILSFHMHYLENHVYENHERSIMLLPDTMQDKIRLYVRVKLIGMVPMFKQVSEGCRMTLAGALDQIFRDPGSEIITHGETGREMFFLSHGICEVCIETPDGMSPVKVVQKGEFFGEMALLWDMPRTATVRSVTYCDLFVLDKFDFIMTAMQYPEFEAAIQQEIDSRVESGWSPVRRDTVLDKLKMLKNAADITGGCTEEELEGRLRELMEPKDLSEFIFVSNEDSEQTDLYDPSGETPPAKQLWPAKVPVAVRLKRSAQAIASAPDEPRESQPSSDDDTPDGDALNRYHQPVPEPPVSPKLLPQRQQYHSILATKGSGFGRSEYASAESPTSAAKREQRKLRQRQSLPSPPDIPLGGEERPREERPRSGGGTGKSVTPDDEGTAAVDRAGSAGAGGRFSGINGTAATGSGSGRNTRLEDECTRRMLSKQSSWYKRGPLRSVPSLTADNIASMFPAGPVPPWKAAAASEAPLVTSPPTFGKQNSCSSLRDAQPVVSMDSIYTNVRFTAQHLPSILKSLNSLHDRVGKIEHRLDSELRRLSLTQETDLPAPAVSPQDEPVGSAPPQHAHFRVFARRKSGDARKSHAHSHSHAHHEQSLFASGCKDRDRRSTWLRTDGEKGEDRAPRLSTSRADEPSAE